MGCLHPAATSDDRANEVVNYLTRYLTGGPISDHRITAADDRHVTFLARQGEKTGGERPASSGHSGAGRLRPPLGACTFSPIN
ncbi:MAG: transposase [Pirellulaceae bacterium]